MIEQPVEVVQTLVDDVLVTPALVLNDDRRVVLVDAEGVDAAAMRLPGRVLRSEESNAKKGLAVFLDQALQFALYCDRCSRKLDRAVGVVESEELDLRHGSSS